MIMKPIKIKELQLFLRQLIFFERIEKKLKEREMKKYAEILEENTREYLKLGEEWN